MTDKMASLGQTALLAFQVDSPLSFTQDVQQQVTNELSAYGLSTVKQINLENDQGFIHFYTSSTGSYAVLKCNSCGLVTLDVHEDKNAHLTNTGVKSLRKAMKDILKSGTSFRLPLIKRGLGTRVYYPLLADQRIAEYDITHCVYEETSAYQQIQIAHSPSYGNILILDNDINLAESDVIYTHTLMRHGHVTYKDKTVLILGGGDGGLLHEIRKEQPAMITMVDIDEMVVQAAKKHLRGICGNSLDSYTGENYEVIIGDALKYMDKYIEEGRTFDYVLYDITQVPVTPDPIGDEWDFYRLSFNKALKVLATGGLYLTHVHSKNAVDAIRMFEAELKKIKEPLAWNKYYAHVPSFLEPWTFYEIWRKGDQVNHYI